MKGICFIEPLHEKTVKKIKEQTRRIISKEDYVNGKNVILSSTHSGQMAHFKSIGCSECFAGLVAKYKIGDILYLKEPYKKWTRGLSEGRHTSILYKYGEEMPCDKVGLEGSSYYTDWKNKLFMPAYAARHFIKITGVRAERLQDISQGDCIKEGIFQHISHAKVYWKNGFDKLMYNSPREAYSALIDKINGKGTWDSNPFVWVYDYELIEKPINN